MAEFSRKRREAGRSVESLIAEYLESVDSGQTIDSEFFIRQHSEHAHDLRQYFENVALVERLAELISRSASADGMCGTDGESADNDRTLPPSGPGADTSVASGAAESQTFDIPQQFGRYRIIRSLGRGAMGSVYVAHDTQLNREVALKVPRFESDHGDEMLERFYREARSAARLRHPNICPVYDVGEFDGRHYISMAFIEGCTLREIADSGPIQEPSEVALTIYKLALALAETHREGIIHRDLKSANVMIDANGEPIVTDFGLARSVIDDAVVTRPGTILGTPAYMAPEQVEGDPRLIGPAADVYALGVIFYELLTGKLPFTGPLHSVLKQVICDRPRPPSEVRPDLDPRLEVICLKMMARSVADRYQSMEDVASAISEALATSETRVPSRRLKLTGLWITGIVLALAVFYVQTDRGTLIVEVDDPGVEVRVVGEDVRITREESGSGIPVKPGPRQVEVHYGELSLLTPEFELRRDDHVTICVQVAGGEITVHSGDTLLSRLEIPWRDGDANHEAVAAVLAYGGSVELTDTSGSTTPIHAIEELPEGDWTLAIHLPDQGTLSGETLALLGDADRIVSLNIDAPMDGSALSRFRPPERLTTLRLDGLAEFTAEDLRSLTACPTLTSLRLDAADSRSLTDDVAARISEMGQLRELHILGLRGQITDRGLSHFKRLTALEQFSIVTSHISDAGLSEVLLAMPQLIRLHVQSSSESVTGEFLHALPAVPNLEMLHVYCHHLENEFLPLLRQARNLRELHLAYCESATGINLVASDFPQMLESLTFHRTRLGDEGLEEIARIQSLERLSIRDNPGLSDRGLESLKNLENLWRLEVSDNPQISDALVDVCERLPSLRSLWVTGTGVTPEGIERLKSARPNLTVVATDTGSDE